MNAAESPHDRFQNDEQLLVRAAELVERGWCRSVLAEDQHGRQVEPWTDSARRWSPVGALLRAWHEGGGSRIDEFDAAYLALALATGGRVAEWNSAGGRTQWHAVSALRRARKYLPEARRAAGEARTA
jgi:hypothetical protein